MSSGEALRRKPELSEIVTQATQDSQSVAGKEGEELTSGEVTKKTRKKHCLRFEDNFGLPFEVFSETAAGRMKRRFHLALRARQ